MVSGTRVKESDKKYIALIRRMLPSPTHDPQKKLLKFDLLKLFKTMFIAIHELGENLQSPESIGNLISYVPIRPMGLVDLPTFNIKIKHM